MYEFDHSLPGNELEVVDLENDSSEHERRMDEDGVGAPVSQDIGEDNLARGKDDMGELSITPLWCFLKLMSLHHN